MTTTDTVLLVGAAGLAVAAVVYWKRSAPSFDPSAPAPAPPSSVPSSRIVQTNGLSAPSINFSALTGAGSGRRGGDGNPYA